ncbi:Crp/Fnr family transcriptional regulator [Roseospirillum parvum]|uniref:Crp/Fnr family transcriptional regulator n=1 Tax=Roseospirillum parvum TaxID=83401 RepID=UPI0015A0D378|nr:Crp/Fnr family transcriptional regulator [Roseospirillum parvum]
MELVETGSLDGIFLLRDVPAEGLRDFARACTWQRYTVDEQIIDQDDDCHDVYFVVKGAVRVLTYTYTVALGEQEVALANITAGNFFGELSAIDQRPRSARVIAAAETVIAAIPGPTFMELLKSHPVVAIEMLHHLAGMVRRLDARVTELSTLSDTQRIICELVRLAEPDPRRPGEYFIKSVPSHSEIAAWAGTAKENVAQTLGELAREGVVSRRISGLMIKDWSRLQLLARVPSEAA